MKKLLLITTVVIFLFIGCGGENSNNRSDCNITEINSSVCTTQECSCHEVNTTSCEVENFSEDCNREDLNFSECVIEKYKDICKYLNDDYARCATQEEIIRIGDLSGSIQGIYLGTTIIKNDTELNSLLEKLQSGEIEIHYHDEPKDKINGQYTATEFRLLLGEIDFEEKWLVILQHVEAINTEPTPVQPLMLGEKLYVKIVVNSKHPSAGQDYIYIFLIDNSIGEVVFEKEASYYEPIKSVVKE